MREKVAVIGAGASGMMAGGAAAEAGFDVVVLEKMKSVGKKLAICGKGRCNITTSAEVSEIIDNIPGNGSFMYSALYKFDNYDIISFFERLGVRLKTERGGRVFPESDDGNEIVCALKEFLLSNNVKLRMNSPVSDILIDAGKVTGVRLVSGEKISCSKVILSTGGLSYPGTGSTGDGYEMAKKAGHSVTPLKPGLVPLISDTEWVGRLQGLSLRNAGVKFLINDSGKNRVVYKDFGEMLFTHYGVSGPVVLSSSRHLTDYNNIIMCIDLKPALDYKTLDNRLLRDLEKDRRKSYVNLLGGLLPKKMIDVFVELTGIPPDKQGAHITASERMKIIGLLKEFTLSIKGPRSISEAIITTGGVKTDEINPGTMESKLVKGLYFAGEIIDVDGYTGGFNLTIAFSTGHLAGMGL